jgi:hypothetical protein
VLPDCNTCRYVAVDTDDEPCCDCQRGAGREDRWVAIR